MSTDRQPTQVLVQAALAIVLGLSGCGGGGDSSEEAERPTVPSTETVVVPPETLSTIPETDGSAPKRSELVGTWAVAGERLLWRFRGDGTVVFDRIDLANPFARGTWTLRGKTLTLRFVGPGCVDDSRWAVGIVKASRPANDGLDIVFVEETCDRIAGTTWTLVRIDA